ncbi:hypothetical protein NADFUDRAFT_48588 [Nadsonia fulvescens var. elongata DSM 6958]|uniref:Uncharacterized protein n=1 Tax=Nadsonia fulvescens var. elongata DSM 6958 TaxID=857566 RepID=A0A1E3PR92_9ASCO|nr:hypothetical protein NADFUDRAFT_48588 [Nadsonia fulvescens var. elongata DSM 6958]
MVRAESFDVETIAQPLLNTDSLGKMGILGSFDSISTYEYVGQQDILSSSGSPYNDSIFIERDGFWGLKNSTDGLVHSMCEINSVIYLAGNFTKIGSQLAAGLASYDTNSGIFDSLGTGVDGSIKTIYCDSESKLLYVGGSLEFNQTYGSAIWDPASSKWNTTAFGGFNEGSQVNSILKYNDNIIFGGRFDGLGDASLLLSNSSTNSTVIYNSQRISFSSASFYAEGTNSGDKNNEPSSIVCNKGDWLLDNNRAGTWASYFPFSITPTKIRLFNSKTEGTGTKTWRFHAYPMNGILNMTYIDPGNNQTLYCDAWCPLPESSTTPYQDFEFVNPVSMSSFQIDLLDYYGSAAGLGGIELFQNDIIVHANTSFDTADSCFKKGNTSISIVNGDGWTSPKLITGAVATYISAEVSPEEYNEYSVVFQPNITVSGNYTILVYTPGCIDDQTCDMRGQVNVTVNFSEYQPPITTLLYETNDEEKYDTVYYGHIDPISDSYRPSVTLSLTNIDSDVVFAADRAQFILNSTTVIEKNTSSELSINGLFEFRPSNFTPKFREENEFIIGNTTINLAGNLLQENAEVNSLVVQNTSLFIGGNLSSNRTGEGVFALNSESGSVNRLTNNGLNGVVESMIVFDQFDKNTVIITGNFSNTKSRSESGENLSNIAAFNTSNSAWISFGRGVNAPISMVFPLQLNTSSALGIRGNFTECYTLKGETILASNGFNTWVIEDATWLENSRLKNSGFKGILSSSIQVNQTWYYAGVGTIGGTTAPGAALLNSDFDLEPMNFEIGSISPTSNITKRADDDSDSPFSVNVGVFVNATTSVIGGHFNVTSNGATFENIIINNNGSISGLPPGLDSSSEFKSLLINNDFLYAGGSISGSINNGFVSGLIFYDIKNEIYTIQPSGLEGGRSTVLELRIRPNSEQLIVVGDFEMAGSLSCNAFCIYDLDSSRWESPSTGLFGTVSSMEFLSNDILLLAGNMTLNSTRASLALYDFGSSSFSLLHNNQSVSLPGSVSRFVLNGNAVDSIFVCGQTNDGAPYLSHWNGTLWSDIDSDIISADSFNDIKILESNDNHNSNDILSRDEILLVMGSFTFEKYGQVSAAFFDGVEWTPFLITNKSKKSMGSVQSFFSQSSHSFSRLAQQQFMKRGFVVLISLAIAFGLICIIILISLLFTHWRRPSDGYKRATSRIAESEMTGPVPPNTLFKHMGTLGPRKRPVSSIIE